MKYLVRTVTVIFLLFILYIIYAANTGLGNIFFQFVNFLPYGDKLGHVFLFGFLVLGLNISLGFRVFKFRRFNVYIGSILVSGFVLIEELSQYFWPRRTLDVFDLLADLVGILVFSFLSYYLHIRRRPESPTK